MTRSPRKLGFAMPTEEQAQASHEKAVLRVRLLEEDVRALASEISRNLMRHLELDRKHRETCAKLERAREIAKQENSES